MDQEVKEFFSRYEKANSSSDISAIGNLYANAFMFGGPSGVVAVRKEDFLKVLPNKKSYFSSIGLSETNLQSVEATAIDSKYVLVKTAWKMTVQNSTGGRQVDAFATYVLERSQDDVFSIVFQIDHQDLKSIIQNQ